MHEFAFAVPGDINQATGGYVYDSRLLAEWRKAGLDVPLLTLPTTYPVVKRATLAATAEALKDSPDTIIVDGLAYGVLPPDWLHAQRKRWVALVHHPLCLETGLTQERAAELRRSELAALALAEQVICTSRVTADTLLREFGVSAKRLLVAEPGVTVYPPSIPLGPDLLLAVGSVIPRKGYDVLVAALAQVADRPWICRIVGGFRDPAHVKALRRQIAQVGLQTRILLVGEQAEEELYSLYGQATLFVHAAHYEGFGMALADAVASGLPTVAASGGAVGQILSSGCAVLVPPGDVEAMAKEIGRLLDDGRARKRLSAKAKTAAGRFGSWAGSAAAVADFVRKGIKV
ncbi:glycosyltransferase family 4 protein [Lacibacterium aquatile]|uniref:Glycosyltransferase family 4 protein n=1 Tax=Lacibacterium aquatile TaxID=1168082 RepID=A0ABW5DPD1_9PROT